MADLVSEVKKRYIVERLNPILEECVTDTIQAMAPDPVAFMLKWMEARKVQHEEDKVSHVELSRLEQENAELEAMIKVWKEQMQDCAKVVVKKKAPSDGDDSDSSEDSDESDDVADEELPEKLKALVARPRQSVSAEAYGEWNTKKAFIPPVIPKSDAQKERLRSCLSKSFLFSSLETTDFNIIIGAMKEVNVPEQEAVIRQGDDGDFLFVIEKGEFDCMIKFPDGTEKVVKTCVPGDVFGELALLYNCPRKATVQSKEPSVCWQLDRDTFNNIVREAAQKKRERYDLFLAKVPLLQSMDTYERGQLADAMGSESLPANSDVMVQGETGTKFYIIEEGSAAAYKDGVRVMEYGVGDYFGELALITNKPRAATVKVSSNSKLLSIDKTTFHRLLHVNELLERSNRYT
mmetsp:Transcript_50436/g.107086  ORF Transcript_50436/g.107086 Transcript_50436/m.107086 type:complete len:406 (-) Transcript_50436:133-1350(-)